MFDTEPVNLYKGDKRRVYVVILETGDDYPPVEGTAQKRRLSEGAITTMLIDDAARYVADGKVRYL